MFVYITLPQSCEFMFHWKKISKLENSSSTFRTLGKSELYISDIWKIRTQHFRHLENANTTFRTPRNSKLYISDVWTIRTIHFGDLEYNYINLNIWRIHMWIPFWVNVTFTDTLAMRSLEYYQTSKHRTFEHMSTHELPFCFFHLPHWYSVANKNM